MLAPEADRRRCPRARSTGGQHVRRWVVLDIEAAREVPRFAVTIHAILRSWTGLLGPPRFMGARAAR